jgi:beta-glucosidase
LLGLTESANVCIAQADLAPAFKNTAPSFEERAREALAGDFNPAGRLPVTFHLGIEQLPPFEDYSMANRSYRYFSGEPLYPFGYGLSHTTFHCGDPKLSGKSVTADGSLKISAQVTNRGAMDGEEVVQLYLTHQGMPGASLRELHGFRRIHLARGQSKTVTFQLSGRDLSIVDSDGKRRIVKRLVHAWIGGGQPAAAQTRLGASGVETSFRIASDETLSG